MSNSPVAGTRPLETDVQFLKGVGPRFAPYLHKIGLRTVEDILWLLPRRYEDRSKLPPLGDLLPDQHQTVRGELDRVETRPLRGGRVIVRAVLSDGTGKVALSWFNQPWIAKKLAPYRGEVIAYGMVKRTSSLLEIASPEIELLEDEEQAEAFARITPIYRSTEGLPQIVLRRAARAALEGYLRDVEDPLPEDLRKLENLAPLHWALRQIHQPESMETQARARRRLVFEEFLMMQLGVQMRRAEAKLELGIAFSLDEIRGHTGGTGLFSEGEKNAATLEEQVAQLLPFELTGAQKRTVKQIWDDMKRPAPMNRLVQGDVGSGKTAVAACAILAAVRCGYQAALMAPTEILAEQHYINLHKMFDRVGISVVLLVGKLSATQKKKALAQVENGEARVVVGTHALIQGDVTFQNLGLAVIDEQHRFGVLQRAALRQKSALTPDLLVMTATPIPRTLTMTQYGDLDVSIIDELPPGRKPIKTHHRRPGQRNEVYEGVRKLVEQGRQAYFVTPMIEENEKIQARAAQDLYERLSTTIYKDLRVALLHGQMKSAEKEEVMERFRRHETDIIVATVVIEVGVDVPNASVIVIEDANRFGLAQLHQLRGRVGRGEHASFCILIADTTSDEAYMRMKILTETNDGFKIAEEDLRLRGPGEIVGTRQSGQMDLKFADLIQDAKLLEDARGRAMKILAEDPHLAGPEYALMAQTLLKQRTEGAIVTVT